MSVLSVVVGLTVVVTVSADLVLTVLHPSLRGRLSDRAERLAWAAVRGLARLGRRDRLLTFGGPAAMIADLFGWMTGLWLGFALVYAPYAAMFSRGTSSRHAGFPGALYLSGESLTTAGFGDVVAGTYPLRLVTVLEAASGLALITAAIAYLTAVYPRVSLERAAASWASDLGADTEAGAARFISRGGQGEVARLHRDLTEIHQDLLRFPVLYYFHTCVPGESITSLLRAATLVCAYLRWGFRGEAVPFAGLYGPALERTLDRLMDDYAREFRTGGSATGGPPAEPQEARARLRRLREAARHAAPEAVSDEPGTPSDLGQFLTRADAFLDQLGRVHHYGSAPLFKGPGQ